MTYIPHMSDDEVNLRKQWHDALYKKMEDRKAVRMQYLGRRLFVPREVTPPAWMSKLLGKTILEEVRESDFVLDMGTGSGINAILAASKSHSVVAVDINPFCVGAGTKNAELNRVSARIQFRESDLFQNVTGKFDLIIFDPPFRWFAASIALIPLPVPMSRTTSFSLTSSSIVFPRSCDIHAGGMTSLGTTSLLPRYCMRTAFLSSIFLYKASCHCFLRFTSSSDI